MTIIYLYDVISSTAITLWDFHKVKIKTKKVSLEFLSIRLNQVDSFLNKYVCSDTGFQNVLNLMPL